MEKDKKLIQKRNKALKAKEVDNFLKTIEKTPIKKKTDLSARIIFAIDATASRQPTWDYACHLQTEMFDIAQEYGNLEVQLIFYRGFGECKASKWTDDPESLKLKMQRISCLGGQTQIGKVLHRVLQEVEKKKVNALIFVGDAIEEDVDHLSHLAGKISFYNLPIFIFQEGYDSFAGEGFRQIAKITNGVHFHFDQKAISQLKDLLRGVISYSFGGMEALNLEAEKNNSLLEFQKQLTDKGKK